MRLNDVRASSSGHSLPSYFSLPSLRLSVSKVEESIAMSERTPEPAV
jgi:hypothetical protein